MRTVVSWAWFRPSEKAWDDGARWYRCDVVGGGEQSEEFVELPETAQGLLQGRPNDRWLVCVDGATRVRVHEDPVHASTTTGARSPRSSSASRTTPTPATGWSR